MTYPVAIHRLETPSYPDSPPYHPHKAYPEYATPGRAGPENQVYDAVRDLFLRLGLDSEAAGTPAWNPLGSTIRPGDKVFLKPNMIAHKHTDSEAWIDVITHGSVIRAVLDYVLIALQGEGAIAIGDAPQTDSDFDKIIDHMGLHELQKYYRDTLGFSIDILDLRDERWIEKDGIYVETINLEGDPRGSVSVNLGPLSHFSEWDGQNKNYYGAFYDTTETNRHHSGGRHEYAISRTPIDADVFIGIPKLKTHKKCGLTANLKGLVGINANKNWLPHYCIGSPSEGGDQFPGNSAKGKLENRIVLWMKQHLLKGNRAALFAARKLKHVGYKVFGSTDEVVRSGNWHGNDTVWRMSVDLNRILLYANSDGTLRSADSPKRFFSVVDGVIAMEGNGPVAGDPVSAGVLVAGDNPVSVDAVSAKLMGFDPSRLPIIHCNLDEHELPLFRGGYEEIRTLSNHAPWEKRLNQWEARDSFSFRPHFGWTGQIEWRPEPTLQP